MAEWLQNKLFRSRFIWQ